MRFTLAAAAALPLIDHAFTSPVEYVPHKLTSRQAQGLNAAMVAKGRSYIGTSLAIRNDNSENNIIRNRNEFGSVTPENAMKWGSIQPNRGQFSWGSADQVANYAAQNGKQLRCHALVYHDQLPNWVGNGQWNNASLIQVMTNHISTVMRRYRGKCKAWDVVNEALEEDGSYRETVFMDVIGEAYIPLAFKAAAEADPGAKLYYNDYNLEYGEEKTKGAVRLVKLVKSHGYRIDGVGFQGHFEVGQTPVAEDLADALRTMTDLGVDVAYTETDIRMKLPADQKKLQQHATDYGNVAKSCLLVKRCVGITLWGVSDVHSWVPNTFNGEGAALLWDNSYRKKPAYDAFLKAIMNTQPDDANSNSGEADDEGDADDDTEAGTAEGDDTEAGTAEGDDTGVDGNASDTGGDEPTPWDSPIEKPGGRQRTQG